jgi:hypothetical protein
MISAATETFCRCTFADREGRVGIIAAAVRTPWPTSFLETILSQRRNYVALNWSSVPVLQRMVGLFLHAFRVLAPAASDIRYGDEIGAE